jgi:hypothetical protein
LVMVTAFAEAAGATASRAKVASTM